jgi:hypothetical protein
VATRSQGRVGQPAATRPPSTDVRPRRVRGVIGADSRLFGDRVRSASGSGVSCTRCVAWSVRTGAPRGHRVRSASGSGVSCTRSAAWSARTAARGNVGCVLRRVPGCRAPGPRRRRCGQPPAGGSGAFCVGFRGVAHPVRGVVGAWRGRRGQGTVRQVPAARCRASLGQGPGQGSGSGPGFGLRARTRAQGQDSGSELGLPGSGLGLPGSGLPAQTVMTAIRARSQAMSAA